MAFDPDAFLAEPAAKKQQFDPDAFLAEPVEQPAEFDPDAFLAAPAPAAQAPAPQPAPRIEQRLAEAPPAQVQPVRAPAEIATGLIEQRKAIGPQPAIEFSTPEMQEQHRQGVAEFERELEAATPEVRKIVEEGRDKERYQELQRAWAATPEQMPENVRLEMNELDRKHGITTDPFEKRVMAGRAKRGADLIRLSQYTTHMNQALAIDATVGSKETAQEKIDRLIKVEEAAGSKAIYCTPSLARI